METDFGAEKVRSYRDRPLLCSLPSSLDAVRTVPRPKELSGLRMQPLAYRFKLLPGYLSAQAEQLRAAAMPFALNAAVLIVVVAVFKMPLGVPSTARHGSDRQHVPTLSLFEMRMQAVTSSCPECLARRFGHSFCL